MVCGSVVRGFTWTAIAVALSSSTLASAQRGSTPVEGTEIMLEPASSENASGQTATAEVETPEPGEATGDGHGEAGRPGDAASAEARLPKVAIVVVGDPDPILVAAALDIEARLVLTADVRVPTDAALRAALRGEAGRGDDGLEEVRRERRRLGLGEARDAPILARLGRRAGAVLVIAVRQGDRGPEAVGLDVRSAQFFDGFLLVEEEDPDAIARFVRRRARAAARRTAASATGERPTDRPSTEPSGEARDRPGPHAAPPQRDWLEENWAYLVAGGLLAAAITFVVVTSVTDDESAPPVLRFQPGAPL